MFRRKSLFERLNRYTFFFALLLCSLFFIAYSVLSVVRHNNYQSFGYDLGINKQVVWRYSTFQAPLTTSDPFPDQTKLVTHVELVYLLIAPFYWIWDSARMLVLLQAAFVSFSGIGVYLLAIKNKLNPILALSLVFTFLGFYGVQNAIWFDVHSATFAAAFLVWFIYFLDRKSVKWAILFCLLAISAKENIGLLTFLISLVYFIKRRDKLTIILMTLSLFYLLFIYLVYFPHIVNQHYLYQNKEGLLSNLNPFSLFDSVQKREALFYSFFTFGFIPLLLPIFLLPVLGDFSTYFILASELTPSHGIYMHYRITLAPLLIWATIMTVRQFNVLNTKYIGVYLIICTLLAQYFLHLPLSYLAKSWFWTEPSGVKHINTLIKEFDKNDSIVAQNNILPHISHRDKIYTLYPEKKKFMENSPCGVVECNWFRWHGKPKYLIVDTSPEWDARHLLIDRDPFIDGISNLEKSNVISEYKRKGSAVIYKVNRNR